MQSQGVYKRKDRTFEEVRDVPIKKQRRRLHTAVGGFATAILVGWFTYQDWGKLSFEDAGFWLIVAILGAILGLVYLYRFISQANSLSKSYGFKELIIGTIRSKLAHRKR